MFILSFWADFWPNLSATLLGLVVGLPFALWTNGIIQRGAKKKEVREADERLNKALSVLHEVVFQNSSKLKTMVDTLQKSKIPFHLGINVSAWESVKKDVLEISHDSKLKTTISAHFSNLNKLTELNTKYLDYAAGTIALLGGAEQARDELKKHIQVQLIALQLESLIVIGMIENKVNGNSFLKMDKDNSTK